MNSRLIPEPPPTLTERAGWVEVHEGSPTYVEVPVAASTTYLTHGLFRYVGKLPPPLVAHLLHKYTESGASVLDPMCGGGTTAIEAVSSGRRSINFDMNPVPLLITSAMTSTVVPGSVQAFAQRVLESCAPSSPPTGLENFFSPETFGVLKRGLASAENDVERALILSIARKASFANTKKINTVVDPSKVPQEAASLLLKASRAFEDSFEQLSLTAPDVASVAKGSAEQLSIDDGAVDFVLLHPPYLTNTAFSEVTQLQLLLLGQDPFRLRRQELAYRGSYFHVPNGLRKYLVGWARIIAEAARVVSPGGHIAVVVGDGSIERVRIPVGAITQEFAEDVGLKLMERCEHRLNNQTGWTLSRRMRSQHVLVFGK